jgi:hypothetical protein
VNKDLIGRETRISVDEDLIQRESSISVDEDFKLVEKKGSASIGFLVGLGARISVVEDF